MAEMPIYENVDLADLPGERWMPIPNTDDLYMVSNMGRVKVLETIRIINGHSRRFRSRIIKQFQNWQGYASCFITPVNSPKRHLYVHKVVCDAFNTNPDHYPCVNHKNEIKHDNRADNLEHCTYSYNITYGSRAHEKDVPVLQLSLTGSVISRFQNIKVASMSTGVSRTSIGNAVNGQSKSAGGFIWMKENEYERKNICTYVDNNKTSVLCFDLDDKFIARYDSIIDAANNLGLLYQSISACCRGKQKRVGNFKFRYE